jgi:DNA-directed RNA polymerase subunit RPC12/RpoP
MTIEFNCQECDASFEFDYGELMEGEPLVCPECGQRAPTNMTEELANALDEFLSRVAEMRSRFLLAATIESDDLPPPYDEDVSDEEEEDEEDEDEDDEEDDDEDDEDDDYEDD